MLPSAAAAAFGTAAPSPQSCLGTRRGVPGRGLAAPPELPLALTLTMIMEPRLELEAGRPSTACAAAATGGVRGRGQHTMTSVWPYKLHWNSPLLCALPSNPLANPPSSPPTGAPCRPL